MPGARSTGTATCRSDDSSELHPRLTQDAAFRYREGGILLRAVRCLS